MRARAVQTTYISAYTHASKWLLRQLKITFMDRVGGGFRHLSEKLKFQASLKTVYQFVLNMFSLQRFSRSIL